MWGSRPDYCKKVSHSLSHFVFTVHIKALMLLFSQELISDSLTSWTVTHQTPLSSTISQSLFKFTSTESVILSNRLIFCHPLLLLPSVFPSTGVFSNESALHIRLAKVLRFRLQHQSRQWISRVNFPCNCLVWSPCCPRESQELEQHMETWIRMSSAIQPQLKLELAPKITHSI